MAENKDPTPEAETRLAETLERFHQLAIQTQNPMYGWLALQAIFWATSPLEEPIEEAMTIPAWIANHLQHVTHNLNYIADGLDPRLESMVDYSKFSSLEEAHNSEEYKADLIRRSLAPKEAIGLVPLVLGLTHEEGWNAFADLRSRTQKMQEFRHYELLKSQGLSAEQAIDKMQVLFGARAPRTRLLRIAEGRDLALGVVKNPPS